MDHLLVDLGYTLLSVLTLGTLSVWVSVFSFFFLSFNKQIFIIESLLYARHCCGYWGERTRYFLCCHGVHVLEAGFV